MKNNKPRVIKDYNKLDLEVQEQVKLAYNEGFHGHLISYKNKDGQDITALPFETDKYYYLIRMSVNQAINIIDDDDDFTVDGVLKDEVREEYEEKYSDFDNMDDDDMDD